MKNPKLELLVFVHVLVFLIIFSAFQACDAVAYTDPVTALAASCVGEARWKSYDTGECATILHRYLKISLRTNRTMLDIATQYSAAIKPRKKHPHPWKLHMHEDGSKPKFWPVNTDWNKAKNHWLNTLDLVREFLKGRVPDPYPQATHYGGPNDIPDKSLKKIETPGFLNYFYKPRWKK